MKIKIIKPTICGGKRVEAKKVIEASEIDARYLVAVGKAEIVGKSAKDKE